MGRWMRFAADRKRQMIAAGAAGVGAALMLTVMTQRAMARTYVITDGQRVVTYTTFATNPDRVLGCLLYTSPSPRDRQKSRMPSSA